ncbi:MAG: AAA family ATPase [Candidatus Yonathbacteria bacterium]|nr:AAA family ATPase [Candidatus Yonathbacteria bacterium]NTW47508.1 AAA family ATPase [Candidatus Yonathbacteria bacterium]
MFSFFTRHNNSPTSVSRNSILVTRHSKLVTPPLAFIFYGRSGSGKGTQARLLQEYLEQHTGRQVLYVETGNGLRDLATKDRLTSRLVKQIMNDGGLMPEFLPIWVWGNALVKKFTGEEHLVLDGLARRVDEVPILDSALRFFGFGQPYIVYLNVPRERAFAMLKGRGRPDDTDASINERLDWFEQNVQFALERLSSIPNYRLLDIDGTKPIEDVHKEIIGRIEELGI